MMNNADKYRRHYIMPPENCFEWANREYLNKPPIWCSVDLRDGNQALVTPMCLEDKLEFFKQLVKIGFKEIEIGFPAASETEYELCRRLIEDKLIPDGVAIQVLTQSREHIIKKTFEALEGCSDAIIHLYNSTSPAQREQVFERSKEDIKKLATDGAKLLNEYREKTKGNFRFEYSPENFTETEPEFALEVCNAVIDIWKPTAENKVIINLPVTVEVSLPHIYACQIEYMCNHLHNRENVCVSLHPHNDRGCAVADSELGLLAGADRVEGTLFGNGERTGNVDLVTMALNMYSHGVDPKLDFSNIPELVEVFEKTTGMKVYERSPYSGQLVFAAFSGSHQNAITKGMQWRDEKNPKEWNVPYLAIDPKDIGREYQGDVIRINSQSGKGGIGFLLQQHYGYDLPKKMREDFGYIVKGVSDKLHKELSRHEIHVIFKDTYLNIKTKLNVTETHFVQQSDTSITAVVKASSGGKVLTYTGNGNGRLDAVSDALRQAVGFDINIETYQEHAVERGANSEAVAYVGIMYNGKLVWGAGKHSDIITASVNALVSAINRVEV